MPKIAKKVKVAKPVKAWGWLKPDGKLVHHAMPSKIAAEHDASPGEMVVKVTIYEGW